MTRINMARVILGGVVAGLVLNVGEVLLHMVVIAEQMEAVVQARNLPPVGGSAIGIFVALCFTLGIATVWLYAAIRPRFGPGVSSALCAGSTAWLFAYLYPALGMMAMGMFPAGLTATTVVWGLVEMLLAAVAGAWLYQEPGSPAARGG